MHERTIKTLRPKTVAAYYLIRGALERRGYTHTTLRATGAPYINLVHPDGHDWGTHYVAPWVSQVLGVTKRSHNMPPIWWNRFDRARRIHLELLLREVDRATARAYLKSFMP